MATSAGTPEDDDVEPRIHTSEFPPVEIPATPIYETVLARRRRSGATIRRWSTASPGRRSPTRSWRRWSSGWPPGFAEVGVRPGDVVALHSPNTVAVPGRLLRSEPRRRHGDHAVGDDHGEGHGQPARRQQGRPRDHRRRAAARRPPRRPGTARSGPATSSRATAACRSCSPPPARCPRWPSTRPTDVAVLPYSSGTTSLPKGVMLTHASIGVNLRQIAALRPMAPDDRIIAVLPFFHIYGMTALMNLPLQAGATVVVLPRFDLEQFLSVLERERITKVFVAPPVVVVFAKHPAVAGHDLSAVTSIVSAAAPLDAEVAGIAADRLGVPITQAYGMTELSPGTHLVPIPQEEAARPGPSASSSRAPRRGWSTSRPAGRRPGRGGRDLDPRPAPDEGLLRPAGGDRHPHRRRRLAAHRRHRCGRRGRLVVRRRPGQGADQVQGLPGRAGRARGGAAHLTRTSPTPQ